MKVRTRVGVLLGVVALSAASAAGVGGRAVAQPVGGITETFAFTGGVQTFTVPAGVSIVEVVACGAQGARHEGLPGGDGGLGGQTTATVAVTPGEVLQVVVGGAGVGDSGGFNGGGNFTRPPGATIPAGGGGGGASDVRRGGTSLSNRIVVGAGGGGTGIIQLLQSDPISNLSGGVGIGPPYLGLPGPGSGPAGGGVGYPTHGGVGGIGNVRVGGDGGLGFGGDSSFGGGGGGGLYGGGGGGYEQDPNPPPGSVNAAGGGGGGGYGLGDSTEYGVCAGNGFVTITYVPTVVPGVASVREGNSGATDVQVPVTLSYASTQAVTVEWTTLFVPGRTDNQADPATDYTPATGTVTFAPGETTATVPIGIDGDTLVEPDEYVIVWFHDPTNARIGGFYGLGVGVITNDDQTTILPGAASVAEGNSGTTGVQVPVTLSNPSTRAITVEWTTLFVPGAPTGQAEPATDYTAANGTVTFAPGETTKTVPIGVEGDPLVEPDEYVIVSFRNPTNAKIGGFWGLGIGGITNDD